MPIFDTTPSGGGTSGVSSFNGRTGAVMPQAGDYTAAQVGAADATTTQQALQTLSDEVDGILAGTSPVNIPPATEVKVGGIKVGEGLSATTDGTTSVAISQEADNATGILNGALYTSIPRPSAVYPLVEVTTVPATASIQVTATKGELSVQGTTDENGKADIEVSAFGVWTFSATLDDELVSVDVAVNASQLYTITLAPTPHIFGATWDGSASPAWSRTDGAELFEDPNPAVNNGTGSSPFDDIMPWSGMEISEDPVAGTLVSIPKYWYKWTRSGASMQLQIANEETEGFYVSPAHADRGDGQGERDVVYVGRYHCDSSYHSTTGVLPLLNITRATARTNIDNLGEEYWQYDFSMYWTIAMLYLVEFANWNTQMTIGYGCSPSGSSFASGLTDTMQYHTGTSAINRTTYGCCQYRHIEGLWDNAFNWVDGGYLSGLSVFCIKDPAEFSDSTGGTNVGTFSSGSGYITAFTDPSEVSGFEWALVPSSIGGSATTFICDVGYTGGQEFIFGAGAHNSQDYGLFYIGTTATGSTRGDFSCRLQKLPISTY